MSDSEPESPRASDLEDEEAQPVARKKPGKKKKDVGPPLDYAEALEDIEKLASVMNSKFRARWDRILPTLENHAETHGLSEDLLDKLWKIFSRSRESKISAIHRKQLIFCLIPEKSVPVTYIKKIIYWLMDQVNDETNKSLHLPMLKYIYGMVEYSLIQDSCLSKPYWYTNLLGLRKNEDLMVWLFVLLKKVTKRETIQRFHGTTLLDLSKRLYKAPQKKAIVDTLRLYKVLRPDLLPDNVFKIRVTKMGKNETKLSETFRKCLFEAKKRASGGVSSQTDDDRMEFNEGGDSPSHQLSAFDRRNIVNNNFFPAMAPTSVEDFSLDTALTSTSLSKQDKMLWILLDPSRTPVLLTDRELIELLYSWLAMNFTHYFETYDAKDHHRYEFILEKCLDVSMLLDEGIPPVDDWILDYLISWDFELFRKQILELMPYVNLTEFSDLVVIILQKFEFDFLYGPAERSHDVWKMFEKLLFRRLKQYLQSQETEENSSEDNESLRDCIKSLFEFMNGLVSKCISLRFSTEMFQTMIMEMCKTYEELSKMNAVQDLPFLPVPPIDLLQTVILLDTALALDVFLGYMITIKHWNNPLEDKEALKRLKLIDYELHQYFDRNRGLGFPILFSIEISASKEATHTQPSDELENVLKKWKFENSKARRIFLKADGKVDTAKIRKLAPNLLKYIEGVSKSSSPQTPSFSVHSGSSSQLSRSLESSPERAPRGRKREQIRVN